MRRLLGPHGAEDETAPLKVVGLAESLGVLAVMSLAMVCSTATLASAPVRTVIRAVAPDRPLMFFGDGQLRVRTLLFGFVFVGWASIALVVTRKWHGVRVARPTALRAAANAGLALTLLLLVAGGLSAIPGGSSRGAFGIYVGLSMAISVLGAHVVTRATRLATGRPKPLLSRSMLLWGACWVLIQQMLEHIRLLADAEALTAGVVPVVARAAHTFAPELVLAWQLPIGIAVAAWFVRTHSAPTTEFMDRTDVARSWGKAIVLVAIALLLLGVAVAAIDRNRVPADELEVIPTDPEDNG
jgi:hypothetical protein